MAANIIFRIITAVGAVLSTTRMGQIQIEDRNIVNPDDIVEGYIKDHSLNLVKDKINQLDNLDLRDACSKSLSYDNTGTDVIVTCKLDEGDAKLLKMASKGGSNMLWMKSKKTRKRKLSKKRKQTKKRKPAKKRKQTKKKKQKRNRKSRRN